MGRRRKSGRAVDGVLVLYKPQGLTSNQALQRARHAFNANRAGHTGALDPLATGVLPLCFGEATKFSQHLLEADKAYKSTFRLGINTSTLDAEGEVLEVRNASAVTESQVRAAVAGFVGDILQVPPMVSALKHQGQPLYKLAREGIEIERQARPITLYGIDVLAIRLGEVVEVDVHVRCSKGTYIRSLAQDIGEVLGVGGHVSVLHRTQAGPFFEKDMVTLEQLVALRGEEGTANAYAAVEALLGPIDSTIADLPEITLDKDSQHYFCRGQSVMANKVYALAGQGDKVRVRSENGQFLGVAEVSDDGCLAPKRLVVFGAED
ncbi:MAG: tRNA pseudouridine(55) synthase TruB [Marinagarivorans sp.]|nr:tRNA pseudouridine(55) synthase TruB [Marinagarivorans sp.]